MPVPRKQADGTWRGVVDGPRHQSGKRRQVTIREPTKKAAQRKILEVQTERLADIAERALDVRVCDHFDPWASHAFSLVSPKEAGNLWSRLNCHIRPHRIWTMPLGELDEGDVVEFSHDLMEKPGRGNSTLAAKTRREILSLLRRGLEAAVAQGLIEFNPARLISLPTAGTDPSMVKAWTTDQSQRFMSAMANSTADNARMWLAFLGLLMATGLRRGEGAGLRWHNVDLEAQTLTIAESRLAPGIETSSPKTATSGRTIAISPHAGSFLRELRAIQDADRDFLGSAWLDTGFVLTLPDGLPPTPDAITRRFHRDCDRFGIEYIKLHGLRHTFATQALRARVSVHVVSRALGHSSVAVTLALYAHVLPGDDLDAMTVTATSILGDLPASGI